MFFGSILCCRYQANDPGLSLGPSVAPVGSNIFCLWQASEEELIRFSREIAQATPRTLNAKADQLAADTKANENEMESLRAQLAALESDATAQEAPTEGQAAGGQATGGQEEAAAAPEEVTAGRDDH